MTRSCKRCFVPEKLFLWKDYYPVGASFVEALREKERQQVTQVHLSAEGICNYCELYQANYKPEALRQELKAFVQATHQQPVVLALSGGKDSLTALYLAKEVLGLNLRCLLYQNHFIPPAVINQAQDICNKLEVPLDIVSQSLQTAFNTEYPVQNGERVAQTGMDFCGLCAEKLANIAGAYLQHHQSRWLLLGNKTYTRLKPVVSALQNNAYQDYVYRSVNLLFALKIKADQQKEILQRLGWVDPQFEGYTSNCRIPGLVKKARFAKLGMATDQGYIEAELRSGAFTRTQAQALLLQEQSTFKA